MYLKRWNIRKNATRKEWQQYFAANGDCSVPNSLDTTNRSLPSVILGKSSASKKRASRWLPGTPVKPNAHQAFGSLPPLFEARPVPQSGSSVPIVAQEISQPYSQDPFQDLVDTSRVTGSITLLNESCSTNDPITHDFLGSPSQACAMTLSTAAHFLDSSLTYSVTQGSQSPFHGQGGFELPDLSLMDLPARDNLTFSALLDIRQELPFARLEQSIQSTTVVVRSSAGRPMLGGFAPRIVADILSSKGQSMVRQSSNMQHYLRRLGAQVPGEGSALIADDQAFETKFARFLLFSMLNGFSGLDDLPMNSILRFLNRFGVNKMLLDVLEKCPQYILRTLADNVFRAAIEAADSNVVNLLLKRQLVDVNETVCFYERRKYTPVERAAALSSLRLMRSLIDAGADVNKSHYDSQRETAVGSLVTLVREVRVFLLADKWSTTPPESLECFEILVGAGARVHPRMIILEPNGRTVELDCLICQNAPPESHRELFEIHRYHGRVEHPLSQITEYLDDCHATRLFRSLISLCRQAECSKCLVDFNVVLSKTVVRAALTGKVNLVQLLLHEVDFSHELARIFLAAVRSQSRVLVDFILSRGPELDPPGIEIEVGLGLPTTPIAEAVRQGNEDIIQKLEEAGSLDHLNEGNRFEAVVAAAAEAGNTVYMRKLLARAITSKQAYREEYVALELAIEGGHRDIVQMLLEAGAIPNGASHFDFREWEFAHEAPSQEGVQTVRTLVASGARHEIVKGIVAAKTDQSIMAEMVAEYPDADLEDNLDAILSCCAETEALGFFQKLVQTLKPRVDSLQSLLKRTVELDRGDLVECLLDMGANPFNDHVLQAVVPDKPDMLRLLLQRERRLQTMPKYIGSLILKPLMGNGAGNPEALHELMETNAINFERLEILHDPEEDPELWRKYRSIRFTPLGMAIQGLPGEFETNMVAVKKFLEAGADPNGISKSNEQWTKGSALMTALMVAIETGREDAVNMLLDYGAGVNARPRMRTTRTALQYAVELGNTDIVSLLLSRGADVNSSASSHGGATALQFAAMSGNCNMVQDLLDLGAQLDALPSRIDGMWPLEGAAANGRLDMIRYLWELNARAVAVGEFPNGFSERHCLRAMNFARENGHTGCRDLISGLSGISVDRLGTDEYGAPWIAY